MKDRPNSIEVWWNTNLPLMMKLRLMWKYRGGRMDKAMQEFADRLIEKHGTG